MIPVEVMRYRVLVKYNPEGLDELLTLIYTYSKAHMFMPALARTLEVSPDVLRNRIKKHKLADPIRPDWTKEELTILEKYFTHSTWLELLNLLPKRSILAIKQKATILGLTRDHRERINKETRLIDDTRKQTRSR